MQQATQTPEERLAEFASKLNMTDFACKDFMQHKMAEIMLDYYASQSKLSTSSHNIIIDIKDELVEDSAC